MWLALFLAGTLPIGFGVYLFWLSAMPLDKTGLIPAGLILCGFIIMGLALKGRRRQRRGTRA